MAIDLTQGDRTYNVTTQVVGPNGKHDRCMGPEVLVTARDAEHAKQIAAEHGHEPNPHFLPVEIRKQR